MTNLTNINRNIGKTILRYRVCVLKEPDRKSEVRRKNDGVGACKKPSYMKLHDALLSNWYRYVDIR